MAKKAGKLSDEILEAFLPYRYILSELYDLWLEKKDIYYTEMKKPVEDGIDGLMKRHRGDITNGK